MKRYDVVVVGAGPGGCMTAKVLSKNGLSVALLERKTDITKITRACATMLAIENERYFNERMYLNEKNDTIVFPETAFSVKYDGPHSPFYTWNMHSPNGKHTVQLGDYKNLESQGNRLSVTFSKQRLLEILLEDARDNGCDVYASANVIDVTTSSAGVKVSTWEGKAFEGTFVVAADGINSRIACVTGMNKKRIFYGTYMGVGFYFNNFKIPYPNAFNWVSFYHHLNKLPMAFTILPCADPDAEFWLWGGFGTSPPKGGANIKDEVLYLFKNSPYAHWFEEIEIVRHNCHILNMWSPAPTPYQDNILFVGDSVWTAEAECTGAMMCGLKAAHAITTAFRDNKLNREGVKSYIEWWEETFPNSENYEEMVSLFLLFELLQAEDINYLFSLLAEKPLERTLNPYRVNQIINGVIMQKIDQIQKENPALLAKLQTAASVPIRKILAPSITRSFPNV